MKAITEKKDPNLVEKVKVVKEASSVSKSAMDTNAKNTKEYLETLKKILETNSNITKEYRQYAEKEIEFYTKAMNVTTTDEERKEIYNKMEILHEDVKRIADECLQEDKDIKERATKEAEDNKNLNWEILKVFGIGALMAIGTTALKEAPNVIKKLIEKK